MWRKTKSPDKADPQKLKELSFGQAAIVERAVVFSPVGAAYQRVAGARLGDYRVTQVVKIMDIDRPLDPRSYLGSSSQMNDRILTTRHKLSKALAFQPAETDGQSLSEYANGFRMVMVN
jgi:hypothetical protein